MLNSLLMVLLLAAPAAGPVVLHGQLVCSGCWTEADRDRVAYGTKADLECAARCARDGLPAAIAVYADGRFTTYRLVLESSGLVDRRLTWIGRPVEVRGTLGEDGKGTFLRVQSLTGTTWESLGFPTGPPER
ncbi:MAG TPA: hypothetical protein VFV75_05675 [Candidatus Polarisedimenticolaceae bacterium]|nr:hypothetical protein [Candidatus Polarisedimenticolaceae bacterium]